MGSQEASFSSGMFVMPRSLQIFAEHVPEGLKVRGCLLPTWLLQRVGTSSAAGKFLAGLVNLQIAFGKDNEKMQIPFLPMLSKTVCAGLTEILLCCSAWVSVFLQSSHFFPFASPGQPAV